MAEAEKGVEVAVGFGFGDMNYSVDLPKVTFDRFSGASVSKETFEGSAENTNVPLSIRFYGQPRGSWRGVWSFVTFTQNFIPKTDLEPERVMLLEYGFDYLLLDGAYRPFISLGLGAGFTKNSYALRDISDQELMGAFSAYAGLGFEVEINSKFDFSIQVNKRGLASMKSVEVDRFGRDEMFKEVSGAKTLQLGLKYKF